MRIVINALDVMKTANEARNLADTKKMVNHAIQIASKAVEEAAQLGKKNTCFYMNDDGDVNYQALSEVAVKLYKLGYEVKILLFTNPEIQLYWENKATDMPVVINEDLGKEKTILIAEMIDKKSEKLKVNVNEEGIISVWDNIN